jgi:hypothetical protein
MNKQSSLLAKLSYQSETLAMGLLMLICILAIGQSFYFGAQALPVNDVGENLPQVSAHSATTRAPVYFLRY